MSIKLQSLIASFAFATAIAVPLAFSPVESASAAIPCAVGLGSPFVVNADNTITGTFTVQGEAGCTQPVSVMTWYADSTLHPKPEFYTTQTVNDINTKTFGVGVHSLTAKLPMCATDPNVVHSYQADIVASANPARNITAPGTNGFYEQIQANGLGIVTEAKIGPGTCPAPVPPTPPQPPVVLPPVTPVVAAVQTPAKLPATGSGSIVMGALSVTAISGALHSLFTRRRS